MAAPSFKEVLENGGGNIQFLFHVSGYNWAVATSQDLVTQLNDAAHQEQRRTIFGSENFVGESNNYWAEDTSLCPIFPTLEVPGKQEFKLHEGKGELTGGNWKVEIRDRELGHDWEHGGSTAFRGLPGVHHVLGPDYDTSVGWAYMTSNLEIGDTTFTVQEQSGTTMKDAIDAASTFPFRLLWVNQECIAVDATSSVDGASYTCEIATDAGARKGRGLFRSKHGSHYTEYYSNHDPIVSDTPFSIIDKPCWLWAVVLTDDGTDILVDPVCVRFGQVSPNIRTRDGVTTIGILGTFKQLDNDIRVPVFAEHLDRYIFTRQAWDGSTLSMRKQAAHLRIYEFDSSGDKTAHDIWLCSRHGSGTSVVEFDTVDDVLGALGQELALCTEGSQLQKSGDTTMGLVDLVYRYSIEGGQITQSAYPGSTVPVYYRSLISGPLAWLFNLGPVYNDIDTGLARMQGLRPWIFSWMGMYSNETRTALKNPWRVCNVSQDTLDDTGFAEDEDDINAAIQLVPHETWVTPYFYQYPYDSNDFENGRVAPFIWKEGFEDRMYLPTDTLYFKTDTDLDNINVGDKFVVGKHHDHIASRPRILKGTIDTKGTTNNYPYITVSDYLYPLSDLYSTPAWYGVGLWHIPALETDLTEREAKDQWTPTYVGPTEALQRFDPTLPFQLDNDPWMFTQILRGESNIISDPFRAILGDDGASYTFAENLIMSDVLGFSDESTEDVDSWIDWDALDEFSGTVLPGKQTYAISLGSDFNLLEQFYKELVFHGIMPTWEWSDSLKHPIMRFREIGPINISTANNSGRYLDENMILRNSQMTETHNDSWMFNKMVSQCNHKAGEFRGNIVVDFISGNVRNRNSTRTLRASSQLSFIKGIQSLDKSDITYIVKRYSNMLRQLAISQQTYTVKTTLAAMVDLAIGRECLVTDTTGYYPFSHEQGLDEAPGLITRMSVDFQRRECQVTARLTKAHTKGWAPAVYVTSSAKNTDGVTIDCTCTANYFTGSGERWDCTYFDCYTYNRSTGVYTAKNCDCGDYKVIVFARNKTGSSWEPTLMYFDVTEVDVTDGNSITLVDQDTGAANYAAWSTSDEHIIIFDTYDNCETCQQKYIFFADDNNVIGASNDPGIRWV